ncbi:protein FAM214A [Pectinophora gossypiella]|uniref:Atos-like conserved domain-containing protein n=1 Tax=Pectinophora gossypiella TaxID=13191 RepID=A0A1E1WVI2_PECGO|nr:protein FAM214A [Pectinophora gossypiella]
MHSSEPLPPPPATGPNLLYQLGRLIIRARSVSPTARAPRDPRDRLLQAKLRAAKPSTSQVVTQPKPDPVPKTVVEAQLDSHVQALWSEQIPVCIEVLLAPDCPECFSSLSRIEEEAAYDKLHCTQRALLLERWTMRARANKSHETPAFITSQWLLNAVRSQLHFSQLAAWLARLKGEGAEENASERRRKLSREQCNFKKLESNCDETDPANEERKLNIVYSIKIPGESYKMAEFSRPPTDHTFPVTDIGNNVYLKVSLESLPRIDDIPTVKCTCQKRRASKEVPVGAHEELVGKLNDLSLGQKYEFGGINSNIGTSSRRLSIISNPGSTEYLFTTEEKKEEKIVDDRMHTNCSENGKHKCNCDEESDNRSSTSFNQEPKKLDERRLKEIAKYKRRLRKENKLKKLCDSTSSEGDGLKKETRTSIPILQAARFDRFRAIGCYRNQTYLTLPASRIETKSPFIDSVSVPPTEYKRTVSVSTQTDDISCQCGVKVSFKCENCRMVRSDGNYNLASLDAEEKCQEEAADTGTRRKCEDEEKSFKKLKCDNLSSNLMCDNLVEDSVSVSDLIKRPKLRRLLPMVDKIEKVLSDRRKKDSPEKDMEQLHLNKDDTVFSTPKPETKRQKTFSISEDDYVMYEKCDYGTIDRCDMDSPKEVDQNGFKFPDQKSDTDNLNPDSSQNPNELTLNPDPTGLNPSLDIDADNLDHKNLDPQVPSPSEMDKFRWRFDSAASMVFHTKTGLPLTSSPAPLRRGNNCFDFDDSINGISGIKSALFHPISPPPPAPASPASPAPRVEPPPRPKKETNTPKLRIGPSTGLLGSFEESALKGRLEPVATVAGFTAELGACGAFCPPHRRLPVTVFFYAPGGTNAPYMGHINLGPNGYRVARSGTIQVSLFNPHGTLVKMFVVLYDLTCMPPMARTFLRQRTLYMPAGAEPPAPHELHKWLRYLIHLRFMTSKSGKLYLHTDIRILVSRKADLDTATAHSALFRPMPTNQSAIASSPTNQSAEDKPTNEKRENSANQAPGVVKMAPNRVFGGCSEFEQSKMREIGYDNQNGVSYELRSFTYAPENPRYSPR